MSNSFKEIVWIASYPKSGNTWLRLFLDAYFLGDVNINEIETSVGDLVTAFHATDNLSPTRYPLEIQQLLRPSALVKSIINYRNTKGVSGIPMFMKTHSVCGNMNGIDLMPPQLTHSTIYIVRDPRDVVRSYAAHMGKTINEAIESMGAEDTVLCSLERDQMFTMVSSWSTHVKSYVNDIHRNTGIIRYEDMKEKPEETFKVILNHIGIEPDMDRLKKAIKMCEISKLQKQEEEIGFKERSGKEDKFFGGKKQNLTVRQAKRIEKMFSKEMKLLGYL